MTLASTPARPSRSVGDLLREWRHRRQLSQLDLAIQAEISARHLSFVETGRSKPTSEMILRLTEHLDVPLRDRNTMLLAGGYAPAYPPRNVYRLTDTGHDLLQAMIRDADPVLLADENEFQVRVAFFADLDPDDRLRILQARREIVEARIAHLAMLRPEAQAQPWGLRVMDFNSEQFRGELAWLDALEADAQGGAT